MNAPSAESSESRNTATVRSPRRSSILLVEDDVRLAELVRGYLESNGFTVLVEARGDTVVERANRELPDLIVLDLGLPGQDGLTVCKNLRPKFRNPVLVLTARNNDIDHVLGLELGADDYVVKPIDPRVLLARINALLRRSQSSASIADPKSLRIGELHIDTASRSVHLHGQLISLSSNEFDLLYCLAARAGQIQSRESLYRQLYHREYDGLDRTLDVRISHLRKKFGDGENSERIKTVWGQGYLFVSTAW